MINRLKVAATAIGSVAAIIKSVDVIRTTVRKWKGHNDKKLADNRKDSEIND